MDLDTIQTIGELFSPGRVVASILVLLLAWLMVKLVFWSSVIAERQFVGYRLQISRAYPIARLIIWTLALYLIVIKVIRPETTGVLAVAASGGLAVGLAAQDFMKNILSGVLLLFDQPFRPGDMVKIDSHYGEVKNIGLRSIRIQTFSDSTVTIPNSAVLAQAVSNSNSGELDEMVIAEFSLPATVDVQEVKNLARRAAASSPYVYLKKPIAVMVEDRFDRTFLTHFTVKAYVVDVRLERVLVSDILERVKKEVLRRGLLKESMVIGLLAEGKSQARTD